MKVVITGEPGVGKTTLVKKLVKALKGRTIGFWTEEVRDRKTKKRKGFKVVTTDGKETLFASKTFTSKHLVGSYGVNVARFEGVVLPLLEKALSEKDKILVADEVGKMELFSKKFRDIMRVAVHEPRDMIVTIPIRDVHPLVKEIRRLPGAVLIELTRENREGMDKEILQLFE